MLIQLSCLSKNMMDCSPSYNKASVSKDYAFKSLKNSPFIQELNNPYIKNPTNDPYNAISGCLNPSNIIITNIDLEKIRSYKHPLGITIDEVIWKVIKNETDKYDLGSLQGFVNYTYPKLYCNLVQEIIKQFWLPATISVFQNKFRQWYYTPGNPGYKITNQSFEILSQVTL